MLTQTTLNQLRTLKLDGMARALEEQRTLPACDDLSFEDRLGMLVDREQSWRDSRRLDRLLRQAKLKHADACLEDVHTGPGRGLEKRLVASLAGGDWIRQGQGVLITGPTGVGKTWLACALVWGFAARTFSIATSLSKKSGTKTSMTMPGFNSRTFSMVWRNTRLPSVTATAELVAYVAVQALLKEHALDFAREYAQSQGLSRVEITAIPRAVSPFNWTVYVSDELAHRYAHVNLVRKEPLPAAHDFVSRMDAAFLPLALARWDTRPRYGWSAAEQQLARAAWESPALGFMRWFAEKPAFDGLTEGASCAWFLDLRFVNPGRDWVPFQYGACRDNAAAPWRAFERLGSTARQALD